MKDLGDEGMNQYKNESVIKEILLTQSYLWKNKLRLNNCIESHV